MVVGAEFVFPEEVYLLSWFKTEKEISYQIFIHQCSKRIVELLNTKGTWNPDLCFKQENMLFWTLTFKYSLYQYLCYVDFYIFTT